MPSFCMLLILPIFLFLTLQNVCAYRRSISFSPFQRIASLNSHVDVDAILDKVKENTPKDSIVVIKYGGHAMENEELKAFFCEDIASLCRVSILNDHSSITAVILLLFACSPCT